MRLIKVTSIVADARASDLAAKSPPKPEPTITTRWRAVRLRIMGSFSLARRLKGVGNDRLGAPGLDLRPPAYLPISPWEGRADGPFQLAGPASYGLQRPNTLRPPSRSASRLGGAGVGVRSKTATPLPTGCNLTGRALRFSIRTHGGWG